jgi:hypothetical protein
MGVIQDTCLNDTHKGREEFSEVRMQDLAYIACERREDGL